ncbi:MAG: SCO1664 family protein [Jatrophihabitans sp.]|nr:MAG: SCO1664 family protein [Jatrophihabitans sp.]
MTIEGLTPPRELATADALALLREGALEVEGRVVAASNATLYCAMTADGVSAACVYKPVAGERPLWDFPDGTLAGREVAAYEVSAAAGWEVVPPTVLRDGPLGPGMVQLWIDTDDDVDLIALLRGSRDERLRRIAAFDAVVNNADRKGGHLLPTRSGALYGVDHGVCFHAEDKLRTVLWQWAGQRIPEETRAVLERLQDQVRGQLGTRLAELVTRREVRATQLRLRRLLAAGLFPEPSGDWPPVPWPPI